MSRLSLALVAALSFSASGHSSQAQEAAGAHALQGTVFDFPASHPDFEEYTSGSTPGQVASELGSDGRMVWVGEANQVFSSRENFDQWYRDVPGVNASRPIRIELTEVSPGRFEYSSGAFFPIDDELLGNEGGVHRDASGAPRNFHFTTHLAGDFTFTGEGDQFSFTGDDDLWVFFNGRLGIDLGGIHGAEYGAITGAQLMAMGLRPGASHRLDIFHAERQTDGSTFRVETNFDIQPPRVSVLPAGAGGAVDGPGSKIDTMLTGATCGGHNFSPAEIMAGSEQAARFLALYCLEAGTEAYTGLGGTRQEAELAALKRCAEAENTVVAPMGSSDCALYAIAERIATSVPTAVVSPGQSLIPGKRYVSASGKHYLVTGSAYDLTVYESATDEPIWQITLLDKSPDRVEMLEGGALAMLTKDGDVIWETPIAEPVPGSFLDIDDDGVAKILTPSGELAWRSDTLADQPAESASYSLKFRAGMTERRQREDGGNVTIQTDSVVTRLVTVVPPATAEVPEGAVPFDPNQIVTEVVDGAEDAGGPDQPVPGQIPDLPDIGFLLTYSINDQVRGSEGAAPDFYVAVDEDGQGVIVQGQGEPLEIVSSGDGQVIFRATSGPYAGMFLTGEDDRVTLSDGSTNAAIFVVRPPLEPSAGNFASFESALHPGQFLRHQSYRLKIDDAGPKSESLLRRDATFRIEAAPNGGSAGMAQRESEQSCYETVQDRIAWDYAGSTNWKEDSVAALCGDVGSAEPAVCFATVMHGGVEWAPGQSQWGWENALALCAGATDAATLVGCFRESVSGMGWEQATQTCRQSVQGRR